MDLSDNTVRKYMKRLLRSRMRILVNNGFYGLLLMHMIYAVDEHCPTAATDGVRIYFGTGFLEELTDEELDFVLMHEILHVVLQHCIRGRDKEDERFNIATDIVVNSTIMESIRNNHKPLIFRNLGEPMHLAPDGKEGALYTAEEVYAMLPEVSPGPGHDGSRQAGTGGLDDHSRWNMVEDGELLRDLWIKRFEDACEAMAVRDLQNARGSLPGFAKRMLSELRAPQINWRTVLSEFVQEEITDYSFSPPDRRFDDSPFFLPDFNDTEAVVKDILFMIDTSASMSDDMIAAAYSEISGAIEQFDGKLTGKLGFFDAGIITPRPFSDMSQLLAIKPAGGGGTDFGIIFSYVEKHMSEEPPASIIILTDGFAPFPKEDTSMGIPVLWLLDNDKVTPPWGKVARIA